MTKFFYFSKAHKAILPILLLLILSVWFINDSKFEIPEFELLSLALLTLYVFLIVFPYGILKSVFGDLVGGTMGDWYSYPNPNIVGWLLVILFNFVAVYFLLSVTMFIVNKIKRKELNE